MLRPASSSAEQEPERIARACGGDAKVLAGMVATLPPMMVNQVMIVAHQLYGNGFVGQVEQESAALATPPEQATPQDALRGAGEDVADLTSPARLQTVLARGRQAEQAATNLQGRLHDAQETVVGLKQPDAGSGAPAAPSAEEVREAAVSKVTEAVETARAKASTAPSPQVVAEDVHDELLDAGAMDSEGTRVTNGLRGGLNEVTGELNDLKGADARHDRADAAPVRSNADAGAAQASELALRCLDRTAGHVSLLERRCSELESQGHRELAQQMRRIAHRGSELVERGRIIAGEAASDESWRNLEATANIAITIVSVVVTVAAIVLTGGMVPLTVGGIAALVGTAAAAFEAIGLDSAFAAGGAPGLDVASEAAQRALELAQAPPADAASLAQQALDAAEDAAGDLVEDGQQVFEDGSEAASDAANDAANEIGKHFP
jgi:hypothetical protein